SRPAPPRTRTSCRQGSAPLPGLLGRDSLLALAEIGVSVPEASRRQYRRFHVGTRQFESNASPMPTRPRPMKVLAVTPAFAECHDVKAIEGFLGRIVV